MSITLSHFGSFNLLGFRLSYIPHLRLHIFCLVPFPLMWFILILGCPGCFFRPLYFIFILFSFLFRYLLGWQFVFFVHRWPARSVFFWWISFSCLIRVCVSYIRFRIIVVEYPVFIAHLFCFLCAECSLWSVYRIGFVCLSVIWQVFFETHPHIRLPYAIPCYRDIIKILFRLISVSVVRPCRPCS